MMFSCSNLCHYLVLSSNYLDSNETKRASTYQTGLFLANPDPVVSGQRFNLDRRSKYVWTSFLLLSAIPFARGSLRLSSLGLERQRCEEKTSGSPRRGVNSDVWPGMIRWRKFGRVFSQSKSRNHSKAVSSICESQDWLGARPFSACTATPRRVLLHSGRVSVTDCKA